MTFPTQRCILQAPMIGLVSLFPRFQGTSPRSHSHGC